MKTRLIVVLTLMLAITSCRKEELPRVGGRIRCNVNSEWTRVAVSDSATLQTGGFSMMAWLDDDYYINDSTTGKKGLYFGSAVKPAAVTYASEAWTIEGTPVWIARDSTRFWCWAPDSTNGTRVISTADHTAKDTLGFSYTMPAGGTKQDADVHDDLLFAYNSSWYDDGLSESVNFKFYHALCQINFIVLPKGKSSQTSGDGSFRSDYKIIDIALQDVLSEGKCIVKGTPYVDIPEQGKPAMSFTWSGQKTLNNYTQEYNADFTNPSTITQWDMKTYSSGNHWSCRNSFFIIPQTIGSTTSLALTLQQGDKQVMKSAKLSGVGTSDKVTAVTAWEAGKRYTYRLAISGEISAGLDIQVLLEDWTVVDDTMRF